MVFRGPVFKRTSGSVVYGPFPIRSGRLIGSFVALFLALVLGLIALQQDHVACTPGASCVVTRAPLPETRKFPMSSLRGARVAIEKGSKGGEYGVVVLVLDGEREVRLQQVSPARAAEIADTIRASIAARGPIDVTLRGSRWIGLPALGLLPVWLTMAYSALKGLGRFRLDVAQSGAGLRVRRYVLGVPVSSHEVSLDGVTEVDVVGGSLGEIWLGKGEAPTPAARVVLVDHSGARRPLTANVFPGEAVHLRAASELRALLGLERRRGGVEERLASLPMITTPLGMRIGLSWIGVTVGSLLGVGLFGVVGLALGLLRAAEPEAWHFVVGGVGGAIAGVSLVLYLTRRRPRR